MLSEYQAEYPAILDIVTSVSLTKLFGVHETLPTDLAKLPMSAGHRYATAYHVGRHHATWVWLLGLQDPAERGGVGALDRTSHRPSRRRGAHPASGTAPPRGAGLLRCPRGLGHGAARRDALQEYA